MSHARECSAEIARRFFAPLLLIFVIIISLFFHGGWKNIYTNSAILPPLLILLAWQANQFHRTRLVFPINGPMVPFLLFSLWGLLSIIWSQAPVVSSYTAPWFISGVVASFIAYWWDENHHNRFMQLGIVLTLMLSALTAYQAFILGQSRPTGLLLNWNNHAAFLNLFLLPLCALYLVNTQTRVSRLLGPGIAIITFAIALTLSRGALLGLIAGLILILLTAHKSRVPLRTSVHMLLWIAAGYIIGDLLNNGDFIHRLSYSVQGNNITSGRLDIWDSTLQIYKQHPLLGGGIGTFYAIYPQYRHPFEGSAGQFAHNDYLQFLMELGPIGLLLALWFSLSAIILGLKLIASSTCHIRKIEIAGLMGAVIAVLIHTVFTFNLYHMPILIVLGLYFGHVSRLAMRQKLIHAVSADISTHFSAAGYRTVIIGLLVLPISFFIFNIISHSYISKVDTASSGQVALEYLDKAENFDSKNYTIFFLKAKQIEKFLLDHPETASESRIALIDYALHELGKGLELHPLSFEIYQFQASLMQHESEHYLNKIDQAYQKALQLNPFYLSARLKYGEFLTATGRDKQAYDLLQTGWNRAYHGHYRIMLDFVERLEKLHATFGNDFGLSNVQTNKELLIATHNKYKSEIFLFFFKNVEVNQG